MQQKNGANQIKQIMAKLKSAQLTTFTHQLQPLQPWGKYCAVQAADFVASLCENELNEMQIARAVNRAKTSTKPSKRR
jgi:hypothetical protein